MLGGPKFNEDHLLSNFPYKVKHNNNNWNSLISLDTEYIWYPSLWNKCQLLDPEIVKIGQHHFWPQKLTLWVQFLTHFVSFWSQYFFLEFWPIEKETIWTWFGLCMFLIETRKNHLNRNWLIWMFSGSRN